MEQVGAFAKAFAAAQAQLANPRFDKVNTAFGRPSGYASLPSVLDAVRPVLNKHGLSVLQLVTNTADGKFSLTTRLMHVSGESVETTFSMPLPADPQKAVALSTYLRRMSLSSMLGVAGDEDDDGNVASAPQMPQDAPRAPRPAAEPRKSPDAPAGNSVAVERALVGDKKATIRLAGTVQRVWNNPKTARVVLEDGTSLKAWNNLEGLDRIVAGKTYEFKCEPSDSEKYPDPTIRDFKEIAAPGMGGEEIPF